MTDPSGQIERVTLWRIKRSKDGAWGNWHGTPTPDNDAAEKLGWEYETRTFIPESTHYSEVERLARELKSRAEDCRTNRDNFDRKTEPACFTAWQEQARAYDASAALLRDSVPASLTRGEGE